MFRRNTIIPHCREALPGRAAQVAIAATHFVNGHPLQPPFPAGLERALFGLGCFWGRGTKILADGRRLLDGYAVPRRTRRTRRCAAG